MTLSNADVLKNLKEQKTQLEQNIETNRTTYLKVLGAIEILEQIENENNKETPLEEE
tara:strand:- start:218 stop:388 length:171 start_codon:yes stop_codon:yes gene_type:complete